MNQTPFQQPSHSSASPQTALRVKATLVQVIGWVCLILFSTCAVGSLATGQVKLFLGFLVFVALGLYLVLTAGQLSMTPEEVTYTNRLATYRMQWDEVKSVEIDASATGLVFCGATRNRRLAVYGPAYWAGADKQAMAALLSSELKRRRIDLKQTQRASYSFSKNTKVS